MHRRDFLRRACTGAAALALAPAASVLGQPRPAAANAPQRPNIIVILSDDMGFSDLGCYGSEINTPNIDRLAAGGLRFTQFYNTARCCPTRACLLTGLYPHQAAVGHMVDDKGLDGYQGDLSRTAVTLAEVLRSAGYGTYCVGKWHVTRHTKSGGPKRNWPLQRGFDRYYGTLQGAGSYFDPGTLTRDNTAISPSADPEYKPQRYYYTDAISDHAVRFIEEHQKATPGRPLFMYVAYTCAHWPMHAPEEQVIKYKGRYDDGYGPIRQRRFERLREMGLIQRNWELSPQAGDWGRVSNKAWEARCMEVYAAMIDRMDQGIGRIVGALRRTGQLENTLILFMQDNGGCQESLGRGAVSTTRPAKPAFPPIPADVARSEGRPAQTREGFPMLGGQGVMPGPGDTFISYGLNWANVSNTPFREYKHFVHEGGIATPLIAHWPAGIARGGELEHQPGHLIDVMATCVDLSGAKYPQQFNGNAIQPMEGRSLAPALRGGAIGREAIYWEHEGNRAVRVGDWKLVAKNPGGRWELYDLSRDRTELHDLAAAQPDRVKKMAEKWEAWARRTKVLPWPWKPAYGQRGWSDQKIFDLKKGDRLAGEESPYIVDRGIVVTASFAADGDGVIVSQGGSRFGYALYVRGGRLQWAVRRDGVLVAISAKDKLPAGRSEVVAELAKDGTMSLRVGEKIVASGKSAGLIGQMPAEGLLIGRDNRGAVGEYRTPNAFAGEIGWVRIELRE